MTWGMTNNFNIYTDEITMQVRSTNGTISGKCNFIHGLTWLAHLDVSFQNLGQYNIRSWDDINSWWCCWLQVMKTLSHCTVVTIIDVSKLDCFQDLLAWVPLGYIDHHSHPSHLNKGNCNVLLLKDPMGISYCGITIGLKMWL